MEHARLLREGRDSHRVLEKPAQVRVVPGAGAGSAAEFRAERTVGEKRVEQAAQVLVVDLARVVLEEPVELVEVAVGHRQERRRVNRALLRAPDLA